MTIKLKKCYSFSDEIDYSRHMLTPVRLHVATNTKETVGTLRYPTNTTELRFLLGLCNVYRRFVSNQTRKAAPLNSFLRKGDPTKFDLVDIGRAATDEMKENLTNPPILVLPQEDKPFVIETDTCDKQVGCVLLQSQDNLKDLRPSGYWSRTLHDAEQKYDATQQECLAVVQAALPLRLYVEGSRFTVRTDHQALKWILDLK